MFDFVTKYKRFLQVLLGLLVIPFAFFGLESYTRVGGGGNDVAVVDGSPISAREFGEELRRQQDQMRAILGAQADPAFLDSPEIRKAVLEGLIQQRLVVNEVLKANLTLPREMVVSSIVAAPEFQEGGKFSAERYQAYLRLRGLSDEANVARLQVELPAARLAGGVAASGFEARAVAERLAQLEGQKREVQEVLFPAEAYLAQVKVAPEEAKKFYDANGADFRLPERIRVEYVVLSAEALARGESVTDAELKAAHDARAAQLGNAPERQASHILVKTKDEAEKILAELKKSPQRFAEIARKQSIDTGSAQQGGSLGPVTPGALASKALEEALFQLKPGELGGPIQTEFGFHVVRLDALKASKLKSLDESKAELGEEIRRQKGAKKLAESADAFNNLVYEQSDSLKPVAERFKLQVATTGLFARGEVSPSLGPVAHPKLLAALFSPDSIQQKRNTDSVEVAPGVLVAARVAEHVPSAQRPFDEVKADIEKRLQQREALALARKEGEAKLATLQKGDADATLKWGAPKAVSRREPLSLSPAAVSRVMGANAEKLPAYVGAEKGGAGYAIYKVNRVAAVEARSEADRKALQGQYDQVAGSLQLDAYLAALRARAKVEVNQANLERK